MSACEVCWGQAHFLAKLSGRSQVDVYHDLITESAWHADHPELDDQNPLAVGPLDEYRGQ
jgi:hypothetical protein